MKDFIQLIKAAQSGDDNAMMEIIESFNPLISKYNGMMGYDEDFRSEMILKLITFIKTEFHLEGLSVQNNYVILKYIKTVMHNHYILLSKAYTKRISNEMNFEQDFLVDLSDNNESLQTDLGDNLLIDTIKSVLTEREYLCIDMIILQGYTAEYVAARLGITKQAVNQCKKRALNKLKNLYCR